MTTLTMKDEKRLDVIQRVYRSKLTVGQSALVVGLSERQCYRIKARLGKAGSKGVVHGNRGRRCKEQRVDYLKFFNNSAVSSTAKRYSPSALQFNAAAYQCAVQLYW